MATFDEMRGTTVYDSNHDKIGTLEEFYVDDDTNKPKWITVKTGLFGGKSNFVPLAKAEETEDGLQVAFTKAQVDDAPNVDADQAIGSYEEDMLFSYYKGVYDAENGSDDEDVADVADEADSEDETDLADDDEDDTEDEDRAATDDNGEEDVDDADDEEADDEDTRATEDEDARAAEAAALAATKREQVASTAGTATSNTPGTLRLKRYVVTENVQFTVPVQREVVRLEPIDDDENADQGTMGTQTPEEDEKR